MRSELVMIPVDGAVLMGDFVVPGPVRSVVLFAHGSGSSRHSPRNRAVAADLHAAGMGTLLMDLLTEREERKDALDADRRFDIPLLGRRLTAVVDWLDAAPESAGLPVDVFGASTGAAAALVAAAVRPDRVRAVVSRGGRPDLAPDEVLERVRAPVLLVVGENDREVLELNRAAAERLRCPYRIHVVPGATHLFEQPHALDQVMAATREWFLEHEPAGGAAHRG